MPLMKMSRYDQIELMQYSLEHYRKTGLMPILVPGLNVLEKRKLESSNPNDMTQWLVEAVFIIREAGLPDSSLPADAIELFLLWDLMMDQDLMFGEISHPVIGQKFLACSGLLGRVGLVDMRDRLRSTMQDLIDWCVFNPAEAQFYPGPENPPVGWSMPEAVLKPAREIVLEVVDQFGNDDCFNLDGRLVPYVEKHQAFRMIDADRRVLRQLMKHLASQAKSEGWFRNYT